MNLENIKRSVSIYRDLKKLRFKYKYGRFSHPDGKYYIWLGGGFKYCVACTTEDLDSRISIVSDVHKFDVFAKVVVWLSIPKNYREAAFNSGGH